MNIPARKHNRAFTLIELLVVILIIAILVAVALPNFLGQQNKAHDSKAVQTLAVVERSVKAESINKDRLFPVTPKTYDGVVASEPGIDFVATPSAASAAADVGKVYLSNPDTSKAAAAVVSKSGRIFCTATNNAAQTFVRGVANNSAGVEQGLAACVDEALGGADSPNVTVGNWDNGPTAATPPATAAYTVVTPPSIHITSASGPLVTVTDLNSPQTLYGVPGNITANTGSVTSYRSYFRASTETDPTMVDRTPTTGHNDVYTNSGSDQTIEYVIIYTINGVEDTAHPQIATAYVPH